MIELTPYDRQAIAALGEAKDVIFDAAGKVNTYFGPLDDVQLGKSFGLLTATSKKIGNVSETFDKVKLVVDYFDPHARKSGAWGLEAYLKIATGAAEKILGASITSHPYFTYHAPALKMLSDALTASAKSRDISETYAKLITPGTEGMIRVSFNEISSRADVLSAAFDEFAGTMAKFDDILNSGGKAGVRTKLNEIGQVRLSRALSTYLNWRAAWTGLAYRAGMLVVMCGRHKRVADESMKHVVKLMWALKNSDSSLSVVAAKAAEYNIEMEKFWQMYRNSASAKSVGDPIGFAEEHLAKATRWAEALARMSDYARGSKSWRRTTFDDADARLWKELR